jgi:predicted acylesterase/phospholipase RssA
VRRDVEALAEAHRALNVLVLSGGGQNGAFGAGLLCGWSRTASDAKRPRFEIVTGVSTGALIATFALLGTPESDAHFERAYTTVTSADIYSSRCPLAFPFASSLYTTGPLEALTDTWVKPEIVDAVAAEARNSRKLYVGTVDMDLGVFKPWDMTALAESALPDRVARYRRVLLAAAAVQALFPPVLLDDPLATPPVPEHMHADGGGREQLFLRDVLAAVCHCIPSPTVYVVVNGKICVAPACVNDHFLDIALRTVSLLLGENVLGNLYRVRHVLSKHDRAKLLLAYVPPGFEPYDYDSHLFDQAHMRALFAEGRRRGESCLWQSEIPGENEGR